MIPSKIKNVSSCYCHTWKKEDEVPNTSTQTINVSSSQPLNREMMTTGPHVQLVLNGFSSVSDQHLSHLSSPSRHTCCATGNNSELAAGTGNPSLAKVPAEAQHWWGYRCVKTGTSGYILKYGELLETDQPAESPREKKLRKKKDLTIIILRPFRKLIKLIFFLIAF